jgi:hypothetical protein
MQIKLQLAARKDGKRLREYREVDENGIDVLDGHWVVGTPWLRKSRLGTEPPKLIHVTLDWED